MAIYRPSPPSTKTIKFIATPNPAKQLESLCYVHACKRHPVSQPVSVFRAFVFYDSWAPLKVHHQRCYIHWCYFLWRISVNRSMFIFSVVTYLPVPHTRWIRSQTSSSWLSGKPLVHIARHKMKMSKNQKSIHKTLSMHVCQKDTKQNFQNNKKPIQLFCSVQKHYQRSTFK